MGLFPGQNGNNENQNQYSHMIGIVIFAFLFIAFLIFIVNDVAGKRKTGSQAPDENYSATDNVAPFTDNPVYSTPETVDHHTHHNYDSSDNAGSHDGSASHDNNYDNSFDSSNTSTDSTPTSD